MTVPVVFAVGVKGPVRRSATRGWGTGSMAHPARRRPNAQVTRRGGTGSYNSSATNNAPAVGCGAGMLMKALACDDGRHPAASPRTPNRRPDAHSSHAETRFYA